MIKFYRVTPVSVVFFRDPRPFSAGEQALARLQFPPRLTPFLGALRTKFLEEKARDEGKNIREIFDDYKQKLENIAIIWFSMLKGDQPILPLPLDTFIEWQPLSNERFVYKNLSDEKPLRVPILRPEFRKGFLKSNNSKNELKSANYITIRGFIEYKNGNIPSKDEFIPTEELWQFENRIGIALKLGAKTADRSKFYRITVARPQKGVGFLVGAEFSDGIELPDTFTTRLGGEGHIAVWEKIEGFKISAKSVNFSQLVALTQIPIKSPTKSNDKNNDEYKLIFKIRNWCIDELDIITGWSYWRNCPKPLVKALKPGAVLSVRRINDSRLPNIYRIQFKNSESILVVKDLIVLMKDGELHLAVFEPELGQPNTLFIIKK